MYERYLASCRLVGCAVGLLLGDHGTLMSCKKTGVTTEGDADSVLENDVDLEVGEGVFTQGWHNKGVLGLAELLRWVLRRKMLDLRRLDLEFRVEGTFFCVKRVVSVGSIVRLNLWKELMHLQELKITELSVMILDLLSRKQERISLRSTMHILHWRVLDDFIPWFYLLAREWRNHDFFHLGSHCISFLASLQCCEKCLAKASHPLYPPLPYQLSHPYFSFFFLPESITFH